MKLSWLKTTLQLGRSSFRFMKFGVRNDIPDVPGAGPVYMNISAQCGRLSDALEQFVEHSEVPEFNGSFRFVSIGIRQPRFSNEIDIVVSIQVDSATLNVREAILNFRL